MNRPDLSAHQTDAKKRDQRTSWCMYTEMTLRCTSQSKMYEHRLLWDWMALLTLFFCSTGRFPLMSCSSFCSRCILSSDQQYYCFWSTELFAALQFCLQIASASQLALLDVGSDLQTALSVNWKLNYFCYSTTSFFPEKLYCVVTTEFMADFILTF